MKLPASYKGSEPYIFISYSHHDLEEVQKDIVWMVDKGYRVWYDEGIEFGQDFPNEIAVAIKHCAQFIIYISPNSVVSKYVNREFDYAMHLEFKVFPVYLEHTELPERLEFLMSTTQRLYRFRYAWEDFCEYYEKGIYEQCRALPEAASAKSKPDKVAARKNPDRIEPAAYLEPDEYAYRILQFFEKRNHQVKLIDIIRSSRISRYELQFDQPVKFESIQKMTKNLSSALDVSSVLINAKEGYKNRIYIEAPTQIEFFSPLHLILNSSEFRNAASPYTLALGNDIAGKHHLVELTRLRHVLIAGTTGSGKTALIESFIVSLLYKAAPSEVKLVLIGIQQDELTAFQNLPHLLFPVITDAQHALNCLNWLDEEMVRRYKIFHDAEVIGLNEYNKLPVSKRNVLPHIAVFFDEFAYLMLEHPAEVETAVIRFAQLGGAAGIHLILATQRTVSTVITGIIKANIPTRIAFAVSSATDSRVIIDQPGAENLLGKGDMLYFPSNASHPIRLQGCSASERVIDEAKKYVLSCYKDELIARSLPDAILKAPSENRQEEHDPMLIDVIDFVTLKGSITVSEVQRLLKIGYAHASRLVDELETLGVVGEPQGNKPRTLKMKTKDIGKLLEKIQAE